METLWSNADEIVLFIDKHKEGRYAVGETFTLPDIGQTYEIAEVRPFRREGKFYLFLDLFTTCAVDGCSEVVWSPVEVNRWRSNRYLTRCCPEHRWGFQTPMAGAWKTLEERLAVTGPRERNRIGPIQRLIFSVAEDYKLVSDDLRYETLVSLCVARLNPPKDGARDTRKQVVERAYRISIERNLIDPLPNAT